MKAPNFVQYTVEKMCWVHCIVAKRLPRHHFTSGAMLRITVSKQCFCIILKQTVSSSEFNNKKVHEGSSCKPTLNLLRILEENLIIIC